MHKSSLLQQITQFLNTNYNFNNVCLTTEPAVTFTAKYNPQLTLHFKIAWHPAYDVPCVFFQIYKTVMEDIDQVESQLLTFDTKTLHLITHSRYPHLVKGSSTVISYSTSTNTTTTTTATVDLLSTPKGTSFFIHPCQTRLLLQIDPSADAPSHNNNNMNWLALFFAAVGVY